MFTMSGRKDCFFAFLDFVFEGLGSKLIKYKIQISERKKQILIKYVHDLELTKKCNSEVLEFGSYIPS